MGALREKKRSNKKGRHQKRCLPFYFLRKGGYTMKLRIPNELLNMKLKPNELKVFVCLMRCQSEKGVAIVRAKRIAERFAISARRPFTRPLKGCATWASYASLTATTTTASTLRTVMSWCSCRAAGSSWECSKSHWQCRPPPLWYICTFFAAKERAGKHFPRCGRCRKCLESVATL